MIIAKEMPVTAIIELSDELPCRLLMLKCNRLAKNNSQLIGCDLDRL